MFKHVIASGVVAFSCAAVAQDPMEAIADSFLARHDARQITGEPDELIKAASSTDQLGQLHVRYRQRHDGLPVFGGELVVHVDKRAGRAYGISDGLMRIGSHQVRPAIDRTAARLAAKAALPQADDAALTDELGWYDAGTGPRLSWQVRARNLGLVPPFDWLVYVDASTGHILRAYNDLRTLRAMDPVAYSRPVHRSNGADATQTQTRPQAAAQGSGITLYNGTVPLGIGAYQPFAGYALVDFSRGGMVTSDMAGGGDGRSTMNPGALVIGNSATFGDGTPFDPATVSAQAHFGAAVTWDYYLTVHGRQGIAGDGQGTISRTHYGAQYDNAYWSDACHCMTYGDGDMTMFAPFVSLDVSGHEMTHGVTSASANLVYDGESGGLNESFSDIFGTAVEFYAYESGSSTKEPNYLVAEDVFTPFDATDAMRYMDHPAKDGQSIDNYRAYNRRLDVHYSSGLQNNVFYLLAHGGSNDTSGQAVQPIGRRQAEQVFYRALTTYLTSRSNFADACAATTQAAADLFGDQAKVRVHEAWQATGVRCGRAAVE